MECKPLFIALLHRLRRYPEAMVLYAALEQHADEHEFKTTLTQMALDILGGQVDRYQVQRALGRLHEKGLVEIRTHANYRTHIKVDRGAVEALLRTPVSDFLPGMREVSFPFLEHVKNGGLLKKPTLADLDGVEDDGKSGH